MKEKDVKALLEIAKKQEQAVFKYLGITKEDLEQLKNEEMEDCSDPDLVG